MPRSKSKRIFRAALRHAPWHQPRRRHRSRRRHVRRRRERRVAARSHGRAGRHFRERGGGPQCRPKPQQALLQHRRRQAKNIPEPLAVYAVRLDADEKNGRGWIGRIARGRARHCPTPSGPRHLSSPLPQRRRGGKSRRRPTWPAASRAWRAANSPMQGRQSRCCPSTI